MGAGGRGEAREEGGDMPASRSHQGDAVRAVLQLVPQDAVAAAREEGARRQRAARAPDAGAPVHLLAHAQQPHRQAEGGRLQLQRHQHAHGVPRGRPQREARSERRQEEEDGQAPRRERLLAVRTIKDFERANDIYKLLLAF